VYYYITPPVISKISPVIYELLSLARNTTAFATSSGVPNLPTGIKSNRFFIFI